MPEVAVNGSVAAKEQDHIGIVVRGRDSHLPLDGAVGLKRFEVFGRTSQPEDDRGPHVRG